MPRYRTTWQIDFGSLLAKDAALLTDCRTAVQRIFGRQVAISPAHIKNIEDAFHDFGWEVAHLQASGGEAVHKDVRHLKRWIVQLDRVAASIGKHKRFHKYQHGVKASSMLLHRKLAALEGDSVRRAYLPPGYDELEQVLKVGRRRRNDSAKATFATFYDIASSRLKNTRGKDLFLAEVYLRLFPEDFPVLETSLKRDEQHRTALTAISLRLRDTKKKRVTLR